MKSSANSKSPSLVRTFAIAFFLMSVIVSALSSDLVLLSFVRTQQDAITSNLQLVAQGAARSVSDFFQDKFGALETLANVSNPAPGYQAQNTFNLENQLNIQPAFRRLAIFNKAGEQVAISSRLPSYNATPFQDLITAEMQAQLAAGTRAISSSYFDSPSGEPMVILGVPIKNTRGEVQGALFAELNLKSMWDLVNSLQVGETGVAYVIDRDGNLIAYRDTVRVLLRSNVTSFHWVNEFVNHRANPPPNLLSLTTGIRDDTVLGTAVPLNLPDWAVVAELPWQEAYRNVIGIAATSLLILLTVALLAGLAGVYLARRLTAPLVALTQTATRITEGELNLQAQVAGPTEISGLALAFNNMTARLRQTLEGLEQRVADRTRSLETSRAELEQANTELQANSSYLAALAETSAGLMSHLDRNKLLQAIVARAATLVHTDDGYIYLQDTSDANMILRVGVGLYKGLVGSRVKPGIGLAGTVWATGEHLAINDYPNWPGRLSGLGRQDIKAAVGVPLKSAGQVIGVIGLAYQKSDRAFGEPEIEILDRFAALAALALENARLFEQSQTALNQSNQQAFILRCLGSASAGIASARSLDEVITLAHHSIQEALSPDNIAVAMVTPDNANFQLYAVQADDRVLPVNAKMALAGTLLNQALSSHELVYAPDVIAHYNNPDAMMYLVKQGMRAVINAPLLAGDKAVGALNVSSRTKSYFSTQAVDYVRQIAAWASASLQRLRSFEQTQGALAETEELYRATRELGNAADLNALLQVAVEFGRTQGFDRATLTLEDPMQDPQAPRFVIHSAGQQAGTAAFEPSPSADDLWSIPAEMYTLAEGQKSLVMSDVSQEAALAEVARQTLLKQDARSVASALLRFGDGRIGYLSFAAREPTHLPTATLQRRIAAFSQQFGTALENQRLHEQTRDALAEAQRAVEREHAAAEQILALNRRLTGEGWQEYLDSQASAVWVENTAPEAHVRAELPELEHAAQTGEVVISKGNGHSALAAPIVVRGHIIGTVGLEDADPTQEWSEDRLGIVNDVVQSLGLALDNARLYGEAQRRVTELDALNRISQAVTSELDLESLLSVIGEQVRQIFGVQNVYVALYDRANQKISLPYFVNDGKRAQVEPMRFGEGLTSEIIRTRQPLLLNRAVDDTMAQLGAKVFGAPALSYLGVPILVGEEVTGVISIQNTTRENAFDEANARLLETIAATVGAALQNAQLYGAMEQEVQVRKRAEEEIKLSLQEKEILLKEIHHRVKNNLQIITSLLNLQSAQIKDPDALLMFRESQARVRSMALIHEKLYQSKDLARIDFAGYVRELMVYLFRSYTVSPDQIQTELDVADILLGIDTAIPCGLIISELVTNSMKYAFPDGKRGKLYVRLQSLPDENLVLQVADDGVGFADDFDWRESDSLGLQLVSTLTSQLHGKMEVSGRNGASFTLTFPPG